MSPGLKVAMIATPFGVLITGLLVVAALLPAASREGPNRGKSARRGPQLSGDGRPPAEYDRIVSQTKGPSGPGDLWFANRGWKKFEVTRFLAARPVMDSGVAMVEVKVEVECDWGITHWVYRLSSPTAEWPSDVRILSR